MGRMLSVWWLAAAVAVTQGSCKGEGKSGAGAGSPASGSAAMGSAAAAGSAAAGSGGLAAVSAATGSAGVAAARLAEADVRALLDRWLQAQNGGDFAAYQALYAAKMEGVKRVAERTWRFDRKGWLADRERMFGKPMKVEASAVTIDSAGPTATVELEQSFAQGKFSDRGAKRLIIVKEGGALRIAREEMLRSVVASATRPAGGGSGVYLVGEIEGAPHVYLDLSTALPDWGTGPLEGPFGEDPYLALRRAGKAPATWRNREVKTYAADGTLCKGRISDLALVGGGTPHFGTIQIWNGDPYMSDDGRVFTPAERAESIFDMVGPYLLGELDLDDNCTPVVMIEGGTPVFYPPSDPDPAARKAALKAYRALPEYRSAQKEWRDDFDGKGEWAPDPLVKVFGAAGGKRYVSVHHSITSCGEFSGQLSVIFEDRGGKLVVLDRLDSVDFRPEALFDSNGDGRLEAIGRGGGFGTYETYLDTVDGELQSVVEVSYPFNDCGC